MAFHFGLYFMGTSVFYHQLPATRCYIGSLKLSSSYDISCCFLYDWRNTWTYWDWKHGYLFWRSSDYQFVFHTKQPVSGDKCLLSHVHTGFDPQFLFGVYYFTSTSIYKTTKVCTFRFTLSFSRNMWHSNLTYTHLNLQRLWLILRSILCTKSDLPRSSIDLLVGSFCCSSLNILHLSL